MLPRLTRMKQSFEITLDNYQSEFKTEEALLLDYIIYMYMLQRWKCHGYLETQ